MWYLYLRRDQQYLRSYRTHNLWLDTYALKMRAPKIQAFHVALLRRLSKSVSGVSCPPQSTPRVDFSRQQSLMPERPARS